MDKLLANRYALETEIAAGSAGTVWRARDMHTGQLVAVKVLRRDAAADADVVKAFRDEAGVLSEVDHPGVVRPRDFVATDDRLALVMDLVDGTDLRHRLRTDGPVPPADAVRMLAEVADALGAVHAAGIVHGDVKPGNILVPHDGGPARLADFGVARRVQSGESATHGTPEYLAPEVVAGNTPTLPADVYALGIVLYELVSGRSPFRGGPVHEVLRRQQDCVALQPPGMPDQVWQLITRCLERDPRTRPSAAELALELRELRPGLAGLPAAAPMPEHVKTHQPRVSAEPVTPVPVPVSPAPVPVSATPVSAFPGVAGPVSPAGMSAATPPGTGAPQGSPPPAAFPPAAAHQPPPASTGNPPQNPWEAPSDGGQPDFLTAVLAAPAGPDPTVGGIPAAPAKRRRGGLIAGLVAAAAVVVLVGFVATLLLVGGDDSTDPQKPPQVSNEHDEAQPPAPSPSPSPSPSRAASPTPEPDDSTPPGPSQPPQDPSATPDDGGDGDDDPRPDPPAPPTNQMPTLPTKPSFPR